MRPFELTAAIIDEWRPPREEPPTLPQPELPEAPGETPPFGPKEVPVPAPEPREPLPPETVAERR